MAVTYSTPRLEYRIAEVRLVHDGRTIEGVAVRYGDTATVPVIGKERIEAGAFGDLSEADLILNWAHRREVPLSRSGHGLSVIDTAEALRVRAELAPTTAGNDALAALRAGLATGLSIEFVCDRERREAGCRVVERAQLFGFGLVDRPAYADSKVAARASDRRRLPHYWLS